MGFWGWLTGKKETDQAEGYLQNSIDATKQTTGEINNKYSNLQSLLTSNLDNNIGNLSNLGNSLLSSINQYRGGANSDYVNQAVSDVNKTFDKASENQTSKLANMGFNPNDSAYNSANAELTNQRASAVSNVRQNAENQAYQNYLTGANMYGNLQQSGINQGVNATNNWASFLNTGLQQNIGANNAMSALYNSKAGSNLATIGGLVNMGANLISAINPYKVGK